MPSGISHAQWQRSWGRVRYAQIVAKVLLRDAERAPSLARATQLRKRAEIALRFSRR